MLLVLITGILAIGVIPANSAPASQADQSEWVQFRILEVECIEQTTDWIPGDEISLGGTSASKHGVDKISYRALGDFRSGTTVEYDDWVFTTIPIEEITDYARVQFSLIEMDNGGRNRHLEELVQAEYELTRDALVLHFLKRLAEGATAASVMNQGSASNITFGVLLAESLKIGGAVAFTIILDELWDTLTGLLKDDAFTPKYVEAPIESLSNGTDPDELSGSVVFREHGGEYRITYSWERVENSVRASQASDYQPYLSFSDIVDELQERWDEIVGRELEQQMIFLPLISR